MVERLGQVVDRFGLEVAAKHRIQKLISIFATASLMMSWQSIKDNINQVKLIVVVVVAVFVVIFDTCSLINLKSELFINNNLHDTHSPHRKFVSLTVDDNFSLVHLRTPFPI